MMMCKMSCAMAKDGMMTEMMTDGPFDDGHVQECCEDMMSMMAMGAPMMMKCGGMMMMCMTPTKMG